MDILFLKAILSLPFWGYQYWKGRIPKGANVQIRLWPVLAGLALLLTVFLMIVVEALAGSTFVPIYLMLCTIPFLAASVYSVIVVLKCRKNDVKRSVYIPAVILSVLHTLVAFYILRLGVTGLLTWV